MELDDLKDIWKSSTPIEGGGLTDDDVLKKLAIVNNSKKRIKNSFLLEIAIIVAIYILALLVIYFYHQHIFSFIYKFLIAIPILQIPVLTRFFKSMKWISKMDYSSNIMDGITSFVGYFKKTLIIYEYTTYASLIVVFVIFFTDNSFLSLGLWLKCVVSGYLILLGLATKPYLNWLYWKKIKQLEASIGSA